MSQSTNIEWATHTWSPVTGCTKVSAGCKHCYAERMAKRLAGRFGYPEDEPFRVTWHRDRLTEPFSWVKPRSVFACSMSDLFHDDVLDDFIAELFGVMAVAGAPIRGWPEADVSFGGRWNGTRWVNRRGPHQFMVLTKRPARARRLLASSSFRETIARQAYIHATDKRDAGYLHDCISAKRCNGYDSPVGTEGKCWPIGNVMLGVTAENQETANERTPLLVKTPAAVRFVSVEPMLSRVNIGPWLGRLDWVICGSESGPRRRETNIEWVRSLRDQCVKANVPFFLKQLEYERGLVSMPELDGRVWDQIPRMPNT